MLDQRRSPRGFYKTSKTSLSFLDVQWIQNSRPGFEVIKTPPRRGYVPYHLHGARVVTRMGTYTVLTTPVSACPKSPRYFCH